MRAIARIIVVVLPLLIWGLCTYGLSSLPEPDLVSQESRDVGDIQAPAVTQSSKNSQQQKEFEELKTLEAPSESQTPANSSKQNNTQVIKPATAPMSIQVAPAPLSTPLSSGLKQVKPLTPLSFLPTPRDMPLPAKGMSLNEAILLALRNNPDVENAELQRVVDKFALEVAHNAFEPQIDLLSSSTVNYITRTRQASYSVGPSFNLKTPVGATVSATYNNLLVGAAGVVSMKFTQPLLKGAGWAYNTIGLANAADTEKVNKLNFKGKIIAVVVGVITSYRALVQDYNNLDIQQRTVLRAEQTVKQSELQVKAGKVAPSDLLQQEANLQTTRLSTMQQKSSLDADYQNFLQALGLVSTANVVIDKRIQFTNYKIPSLAECIRLALEGNIDYQSAIIQLRSSQRAVLAAENQRRWQVDLGASTTAGSNTGTGTVPAGTPGTIINPDTSPSVSLTVNIPINDMAARQALISARVGLEQAQNALEEKKQQLIRNITNQVNQIHNQYEQIRVAISAVNLQMKTLENAELKLKYGKSTVFEVNQLQDQLLQQQTSLVSNKIQLLNSVTTLNQTLGITLDKWHIKLRY